VDPEKLVCVISPRAELYQHLGSAQLQLWDHDRGLSDRHERHQRWLHSATLQPLTVSQNLPVDSGSAASSNPPPDAWRVR
jgi:hypothetical protein